MFNRGLLSLTVEDEEANRCELMVDILMLSLKGGTSL